MSESDVQSVSVRSFVAARVSEIASLTSQINRTGATSQGRVRGFSFQHVSKHMRRRAVSHNPKRLPIRLRYSHMRQLSKSSGGSIRKPKRPSRKYRKRPERNILEYNRRQLGKPAWLESHIWHAKRFHMKFCWGRKLAIAPTAKCFRSLYHAARKGAVMQDISYLNCLELCGPTFELINGLSTILPMGFCRGNLTKERLGHVYSQSNSSYIGTIKYLWASDANQNDNSKIIIWLHSSSRAHIVDILLKTFELKLVAELDIMKSHLFPEWPNQDEQKHLWKLLDGQAWTNVSKQLSLKDISDSVNRIRITGLKTLSILKEIFKIGIFNVDAEDTHVSKSVKEEQEQVWGSIEKIVDVPNDTAISLNVVDPRLELPKKRQRVEYLAKSKSQDKSTTTQALFPRQSTLPSPLWDEDIIKRLLRTKTSDMELAKIRSQNLIPGTSITQEFQPNVVPVVLIFRSGRSSRLDTSAYIGADIIVPMGWLMPFWIALSFRCVRAHGLEFCDYLTFEGDPFLQNLPVSRLLAPDSPSYGEEKVAMEKELRQKYFSRPPAKRHNLIKLGCAFPFSIDWPRFIGYISGGRQEVSVIRSPRDVVATSKFLMGRSALDDKINDIALLPIEVTLLSGTVEEKACIYLPTLEDLIQLTNGKGRQSKDFLQQGMFKDINEGKRDDLSRKHNKKMSLLRKKRKAARKAAVSKTFDLKSRIEALDSKDESSQFNMQMNNLWVNEDVENIFAMQDREILGFTTYAHFSFLKGRSAATGYVNLKQLKKLMNIRNDMSTCQDLQGKRLNKNVIYVLVRNWSSSLSYRWAKLNFPKI